MGVRRHIGNAVGGDVAIHTHHHGAQSVFAHGEYGVLHTAHKFCCGHGERLRIRLHGSLLRELVAIDANEVVLAVLIADEDGKVVIVDFKLQAKVGELLQQFKNRPDVDRKLANALRLGDRHACGDGGFLIAAGDHEAAVFKAEQEVVEN